MPAFSLLAVTGTSLEFKRDDHSKTLIIVTYPNNNHNQRFINPGLFAILAHLLL